jgi:hypothetical protein
MQKAARRAYADVHALRFGYLSEPFGGYRAFIADLELRSAEKSSSEPENIEHETDERITAQKKSTEKSVREKRLTFIRVLPFFDEKSFRHASGEARRIRSSARHQLSELGEEVERVMRTRSCFGVILNGEERFGFVPYSLDRVVVQIDVSNLKA